MDGWMGGSRGTHEICRSQVTVVSVVDLATVIASTGPLVKPKTRNNDFGERVVGVSSEMPNNKGPRNQIIGL